MEQQKRRYKPKLSKETIDKIIKLHHEEFLGAHEIADMLDISVQDVVWVISPHY